MRVAHCSDWHIDYSSGTVVTDDGVNVRLNDGYSALREMVDQIIKADVDLVVIAGDTFHTPHPTIRSIIEVQNALRKLSKHTEIVMLGGNHDILDVRESIAASRVVDDRERNIYSYDEPYVVHRLSNGTAIHLVSHHAYTIQQETLPTVKPVEGVLNIFATHGSIVDPILHMKLQTEQSPREIVIPDGLAFGNEWDALMLGHIHERSQVQNDSPTFYNGSLIRRGFADKDCELGRGWTLWEFNEDGSSTRTFHEVGQRPQYDFEIIDAESLSHSEVADLVIERLRVTQVAGGSFDVSIAPIIRQRIVNLSPAKDAALQRNLIQQETKHTLSFQMPVSRLVPNNVAGGGRNTPEVLGAESGDIITQYELWTPKSPTLMSVSENLRKSVIKQTKDFLKAGRDSALE